MVAGKSIYTTLLVAKSKHMVVHHIARDWGPSKKCLKAHFLHKARTGRDVDTRYNCTRSAYNFTCMDVIQSCFAQFNWLKVENRV